MAIISPSILSADFCRLEEDCRLVLDAGAQMLHFDVMDGHFVPNISFGVPVLASLHRGMPSAFFDVHLMISHPLDYVDAFAGAGAGLINFHLESEDDPGDVLHAIRAAGCKAGMTIKPDTPADYLSTWLDQLDLVLVMTVEPGFGGQAFLEDQLDTIRRVRALIEKYNPACELEVDGGIAPKTAPLVVEAGANVLVAGSAVYGAADPAAAIAALRGGR